MRLTVWWCVTHDVKASPVNTGWYHRSHHCNVVLMKLTPLQATAYRWGEPLPSAAPIIENPDVHVEQLTPRSEPRSEPSTPSPAKEEPGLPQWAAVLLIGLVAASIILFFAYLALWRQR